MSLFMQIRECPVGYFFNILKSGGKDFKRKRERNPLFTPPVK